VIEEARGKVQYNWDILLERGFENRSFKCFIFALSSVMKNAQSRIKKLEDERRILAEELRDHLQGGDIEDFIKYLGPRFIM
jgi:hypothetical protein